MASSSSTSSLYSSDSTLVKDSLRYWEKQSPKYDGVLPASSKKISPPTGAATARLSWEKQSPKCDGVPASSKISPPTGGGSYCSGGISLAYFAGAPQHTRYHTIASTTLHLPPTHFGALPNETTLFFLSPSYRVSVDELKHKVKEKRSNFLQGVDASDLTLSKVDVDYDEEMREKIKADQYWPAPNDRVLDAMEIISQVWPARPPHGHLHVFALLPRVTRGLKRPREGSTSNDYEWHHGWRQLGDDDPWKRFSDYWRKQNVETTCERPSITLAYEERGEENPKYRLPLVPEIGNKIIVRDCYKSFYDHILKLRSRNVVGLVLTGQPGTGKTLWLPYALVRLLTENETVAYHDRSGTILFLGNLVYSRILGVTTKMSLANPATFCLIDSDGEKKPMDIGFMTDRTVVDRTFPIMASSPRPSRYSMANQRLVVPTESMPLWRRDELKKGLEIQPFYAELRRDVETVLRSLSVDDINEERRNLILSALK